MKNIYHFKELTSTSTYLKENYEKYADLTIVSADYQSQGHGRYNREWISNKGENLLFSILIKDKEIISKYSDISLSSAVCVYETLKQLNIKNVSIKWPNDVFVNDKKIAGILLESISFNSEIEALILGVGINVNSTSFRNNMINTPTSICLELNEKILLDNFKIIAYDKFMDMLEKIKSNDKNYLRIIKENNYLKGKKVFVLIQGKKKLVEVVDVNDNNSIKIKYDDKYVDIYSGEISFHI